MVITRSVTLYSAFGVAIQEISHGEKKKNKKIMQNYGGIFGSNMKPLPSTSLCWSSGDKYTRDIPDGRAVLTESILHCLDKCCNCYRSDLDVRDVIIEFFIKSFLSRRHADAPQTIVATLIEIKNAQLEQNLQEKTFEYDLRFSCNKTGLFWWSRKHELAIHSWKKFFW